jgi:transcription elongation factor Elf1
MKITVTALGLPPETFENCCERPQPVASKLTHENSRIFLNCGNCGYEFVEIDYR